MNAIVYHKYGSPDVLQLTEVEKPVPRDDEVLVKVQAASVNPLDWHTLRGEPFLQRLASGLLKPKNRILGADIAGKVEEVGKKVKDFKTGDEVFGDLYRCGFGGFAEYVSVPEHSLALKPGNITFEEAAATPQAAITALHALSDVEQEPDQKVLVNGASGGVGTFTVQIARAFGAEVTGVCSTRNLDMVRSIGADHVIDYTKEDFTKMGQSYDLIVDAVANRSLSDLRKVLNPKGICVVVGFSSLLRLFQVAFAGPLVSKGGKKISMLMPKENKEDLNSIKDFLETGKIVPVIDRRYPLKEVSEAIRYLEEGHARGKVVITLEHN
ncbi:NAD(P)-dependent alcohol dehydrogenase [Bacteroidota bacterium]